MPGVELCRDILVTKEVDGASHHKQAGVNFIFIILEQEDISIYARLMSPPNIHGRTGDVRSEAVVDCEIWWFRLCNRTETTFKLFDRANRSIFYPPPHPIRGVSRCSLPKHQPQFLAPQGGGV